MTPAGVGSCTISGLGGCLSTRWGGFLKPHCPLCPKRGRPASGSHTRPGHPIVCCCPLHRPPACLSFFSPRLTHVRLVLLKAQSPPVLLKGRFQLTPGHSGRQEWGRKLEKRYSSRPFALHEVRDGPGSISSILYGPTSLVEAISESRARRNEPLSAAGCDPKTKREVWGNLPSVSP